MEKGTQTGKVHTSFADGADGGRLDGVWVTYWSADWIKCCWIPLKNEVHMFANCELFHSLSHMPTRQVKLRTDCPVRSSNRTQAFLCNSPKDSLWPLDRRHVPSRSHRSHAARTHVHSVVLQSARPSSEELSEDDDETRPTPLFDDTTWPTCRGYRSAETIGNVDPGSTFYLFIGLMNDFYPHGPVQ